MSWRKLPVSLKELCIDTTLRCGQSFRWRKSEDNIWSCALYGRLISLKQDSTHLHYKASFPTGVPPSAPSSATPTEHGDSEIDDTTVLIRHYLNLEPNLTELYEQWSAADANFRKKAPKFTGVRILRQDAWEALIGFICSSNNNIIRISQMMEKLCINYGPLIGHIDAKPFYAIPEPKALTSPKVEQHLRELGFGYRARYIYETACMVAEHPEGWLDNLRNPEAPVLGQKFGFAGAMLPGGREGYRKAHEALLDLQGVGPKVADCVCLMGLGWGEAVPVDTHVWQIAQKDYKFGKGKHSSLTKATYDAIGDLFRSLWGKEAGWAHSVLFTADLRVFSERLTAKVEVKEEIYKTENGEMVKTEIKEVKKEVKIKSEFSPVKVVKSIKREFKEEDENFISTPESARSARLKRRRWD
jgi:N-glycosylase/DNA lyase